MTFRLARGEDGSRDERNLERGSALLKEHHSHLYIINNRKNFIRISEQAQLPQKSDKNIFGTRHQELAIELRHSNKVSRRRIRTLEYVVVTHDFIIFGLSYRTRYPINIKTSCGVLLDTLLLDTIYTDSTPLH